MFPGGTNNCSSRRESRAPVPSDTGVLLALADRSDAWHRKARTFLASTHDTLLIPVTVLPEVAYLLHERIGPHAERAFVHAIAERELAVEEIQARDWRASRWCHKAQVDASRNAITPPARSSGSRS